MNPSDSVGMILVFFFYHRLVYCPWRNNRARYARLSILHWQHTAYRSFDPFPAMRLNVMGSSHSCLYPVDFHGTCSTCFRPRNFSSQGRTIVPAVFDHRSTRVYWFRELEKIPPMSRLVGCFLSNMRIYSESLTGIMRASTIVLLVLSPINIGLNIVLIHYTTLGLFGSPIALSIIYWLAFILLGVMTAASPTHRRNGTWGGLQFRKVLRWKSCMTFFQLALPGILMVGTEW